MRYGKGTQEWELKERSEWWSDRVKRLVERVTNGRKLGGEREGGVEEGSDRSRWNGGVRKEKAGGVSLARE